MDKLNPYNDNTSLSSRLDKIRSVASRPGLSSSEVEGSDFRLSKLKIT